MNGIVSYGSNFTADTGREPSANIWKNMPTGLMTDPSKGQYIFKDVFPTVANNIAAAWYGSDLQVYTGATAGSDITDAATLGGAVKLESTTDDQGCAIRTPAQFQIDIGQGRLWFEARIKQVNITDSKFNMFCGLVETGAVAATLPLTTSDAVSDNNLVGFQRVFVDGDALDTTYKADSVTQVTVGTDAITTVADTYVKVGMYFDGSVLYFYKDGVRLADSKTIPTADGTDFPNDVRLGFVFAVMMGHGDTGSATIDWFRVAQEKAP